jgi:hypothetical protein
LLFDQTIGTSRRPHRLAPDIDKHDLINAVFADLDGALGGESFGYLKAPR